MVFQIFALSIHFLKHVELFEFKNTTFHFSNLFILICVSIVAIKLAAFPLFSYKKKKYSQ